MLAANLANFGRIGVIYHKSIEQALVIFPALIAALITVGGGVPTDEGGKLDFKVDLGDPPPCSVGFMPPPQMRTPADETLREVPTDMYCKTAQNDPTVVRGARNYPCQEFPGKRAPTIQLCRDPKGYVPIGSNPWRGPPCRTARRSTDPRMTLPPNKFPYIPPGADSDPGPPVVPLPPGVAPGPGPAPHRRTRAGAAERARPAAAVAVLRAAGSVVPPYPQRRRRPLPPAPRPPPGRARCPRRRHRRPAGPHHDLRPERQFVDPAGGTGIFASG